jgi:hypothetical protein
VKSTIDKHADRPAIEAALARKVPLRKIGRRYGVTIDALFRFKRRLLRDCPEMFIEVQAKDWGKVSAEELEALRIETSEGWLRNIRSDLGKVIHFRELALAADDHQAAAAWTAHIIRYFKLMGEAVQHLKSHTVNVTNNFFESPDYWLFQRSILEALRDHPAALADVLRALENVGNGAAPPMITVSPVGQHEAAA